MRLAARRRCKQMGYLQSSNVGSLNKAVISIWFRIPAGTAAAASDSYELNAGFGFWQGVVPLLTWGPQVSGTKYVWTAPDYGFVPELGNDVFGDAPTSSYTSPQGPSYIGVKFSPVEGLNNRIEVLIQTNAAANCTNTRAKTTGYAYPDFSFEDASYVDEGYKDYFGGAGAEISSPTDAWHHILISWDLSGSNSSAGSGTNTPSDPAASVGSSSKMWLAIDGVNKSGAFDLPAQSLNAISFDGSGFDPNGIVSAVTALYAGVANDQLGDTASVSLSIGSIPSNPCSIPGPATISHDVSGETPGDVENVAPVLLVETARLQIFTGVILDTGADGNIQAFITPDGTPASLSLARLLLGKAPDVEFDKSKDWINGRNTGSRGPFTVTGSVTKYDQDPSL